MGLSFNRFLNYRTNFLGAGASNNDAFERNMSLHFCANRENRNPYSTNDGIPEGRIYQCRIMLAFVLNVPQLKNLGAASAEHPVLWVISHSTEKPNAEWKMATVELEKNKEIHDISFYGEAPG